MIRPRSRRMAMQQFFVDGTLQSDITNNRIKQILTLELAILHDEEDNVGDNEDPDVGLDVSSWERNESGLLILPDYPHNKYCAPVITVELLGTGDDTEHKNWYLDTSGGRAGKRMWQHMWQAVNVVNCPSLIAIARLRGCFPCLRVLDLGRR